MHNATKHRCMTRLVGAAALLAGSMAQADVVSDWNITVCDIAVAAKLPPPPAYRVMSVIPCKRWRTRASTTGCTTATPRRSAPPWANR